MAALSGIFESRISSRFTSFSRASETGDAGEAFEKEAASRIKIASDVRLEGARIGRIWEDGDSGLFHALAVLDRDQAGRTWTARALAVENEIQAEIRALDTLETRLSRMASLNRIMDLAAQRAVLDARLGVTGAPVPEMGVDLAALAGELAELKAGLRVSVHILGREGIRTREIIARGLSRKGIVLVMDQGTANARIIGSVEMAPVALDNPNAVFVRASGSVRIFEEQPQIIFAQINENIRKGHQDIEEARRRAVVSVAEALKTGVLKALGYDKKSL